VKLICDKVSIYIVAENAQDEAYLDRFKDKQAWLDFTSIDEGIGYAAEITYAEEE
jgi:hypothetical protein